MSPSIQKTRSVEIDPELLASTASIADNFTIVHCNYSSALPGQHGIRIWPTTFLIQEDGSRKKLLHTFNIPLYPEWKYFTAAHYNFTLLFEGLDKNCKLFDLLEDIPESNEFFVSKIKRNATDVYHLKVS